MLGFEARLQIQVMLASRVFAPQLVLEVLVVPLAEQTLLLMMRQHHFPAVPVRGFRPFWVSVSVLYHHVVAGVLWVLLAFCF